MLIRKTKRLRADGDDFIPLGLKSLKMGRKLGHSENMWACGEIAPMLEKIRFNRSIIRDYNCPTGEFD